VLLLHLRLQAMVGLCCLQLLRSSDVSAAGLFCKSLNCQAYNQLNFPDLQTEEFHEAWRLKARDVLARAEWRRRKLTKRVRAAAEPACLWLGMACMTAM